MDRNLFLTGLTFSLIAHATLVAVFSAPIVARKHQADKPFKSLEVTYRDLKSEQKRQKTSFDDLKVIQKESYDDQKIKVLDKNDGLFSTVGAKLKDITKLTGKLRPGSKSTQKLTTLDLSKKITLPPLSTEKITNPKYLTYNDGMRDAISRNIKRRAYAYVNHPDFEAGEVYLTFVLTSGGELKGVKIIEEKTRANTYLREVALRSIKESNPFPPFPEGFDYPEFTFNLLISFQN